MRVAVIQMNAGRDKSKNVDKAVALVEAAARNQAKLICLPEIFNYRGSVNAKNLNTVIAESIPGPSVLPLAKTAKEKKVFILAGSIIERGPRSSARAYNTSAFLNDQGRIVGTYRKRNLFEAQLGLRTIQEAKNFIPGKKFLSAKVKEFQVGVSICYDVRFAEIYAAYRRQGCQVLAVPSAFTEKTGRAHWEILLRTRAVENLCYALGPNQVGADDRGLKAYGNSLIVSPWGEILARGSDDKEEILYADISLEEVKKARQRLPSLFKNR